MVFAAIFAFLSVVASALRDQIAIPSRFRPHSSKCRLSAPSKLFDWSITCVSAPSVRGSLFITGSFPTIPEEPICSRG